MEPRKIYQVLKEKIIWLEILPEATLNLTELANEFGVSRTPIKEALLLLEVDDWILHNNAHFLVTPLSIDRIKDITEIRSAMEVHATVWAMERISPGELNELIQLREEISELDDAATMKKMLELDFKFHRMIYRATKNNQVAQLLERILGHHLRFWLASPQEVPRRKFFDETLRIIQGIEARDEDKVKAAALAHIRATVDDLRRNFLRQE